MPAEKARQVVEEELRGTPLEEVFEWIDLDTPLGSASISQVALLHSQQQPWDAYCLCCAAPWLCMCSHVILKVSCK